MIFSEHFGVMDHGEPDEGPFCDACGEHFPCTEVIDVKRKNDNENDEEKD